MGKSALGGSKVQNVSNLTPQQRSLFNQVLGGLGGEFTEGLRPLLQQPQQQSYEDIFQRTYVQPAMQTYQENILPAIQQRFVDLNAGSSSALNNALAESARNLSTQLGSQFGEFQQRQKFGDIQNQLSALGLFAPFITGQTMTPVVSQKEGWLGPVLSAAAQVAGAKYGAK